MSTTEKDIKTQIRNLIGVDMKNYYYEHLDFVTDAWEEKPRKTIIEEIIECERAGKSYDGNYKSFRNHTKILADIKQPAIIVEKIFEEPYALKYYADKMEHFTNWKPQESLIPYSTIDKEKIYGLLCIKPNIKNIL